MEPSRPIRSRGHYAVLAACLLAPLALFALGRALEPDARGWGTHEQLGFRPCFPMRAWNVPCPGCGVTTAIALAAHGALLSSVRTQPFGLVTLVAALAAGAWAVVAHARGRELVAELANVRWRRWFTALAALALIAWAYKLALVRGWLG